MTGIEIDVRELKGLGRKMNRTIDLLEKRLPDLVGETADDMLATTIRNASGRPGPNIVTGEYVSRFFTWMPDQYSFLLENPSPQTHRLEYGFYGTDSAGRVYNQPAFPHMLPAQAEVYERFREDLQSLIMDCWRVA